MGYLTFQNYFLQHLVDKYGTPSEKVQNNFVIFAIRMNSLLFAYHHPANFTSVWRPEEYNKLIGGAEGSLHEKALAADLAPDVELFLAFLKSKKGQLVLQILGLYFYIGYDESGIKFFHFQAKKTPHSDTKTHQFYTKKYPRKYIV